MSQKESSVAHVVVDMLYDFIDGTLACINAEEAVIESIKFINDNPSHVVIYICDSHPKNHCSFSENGGIWPPHCVAGTRGSQVHENYYNNIIKEESRPSLQNTLKKGENPNGEQYSGFKAITPKGKTLSDFLEQQSIKKVVISGIATEFCVNETAKDLMDAGFDVTVIAKALAYVDYNNHIKTLENFKKLGIKII